MYKFFAGKVTYIGCGIIAISGEIIVWVNYTDLTLMACGIGIIGFSITMAGLYRRIRHGFFKGGRLNHRYTSSSEETMMGIR